MSPLKKHEEWLFELVRQEPDQTVEEIPRRLLDQRQQKARIGGPGGCSTAAASASKRAGARPGMIDLTLDAERRVCVEGIARSAYNDYP